MNKAGPELVWLFSLISVAIYFPLAPYALKRRDQISKRWHEHKRSTLYIAVFNPLAYILVLYTLTFTPVVYVAPASEASVLIMVLAGAFILNEGKLGKRMPWAVLIFFAMLLLALD